MTVHVTTQMRTRAEHTDQVIAALREALPRSLEHEGCQAIHLRQEQDDPTNIVSFTQWATRQNYEDYLTWRTETGMTDDINELLTEPLSIKYFDDLGSVVRRT